MACFLIPMVEAIPVTAAALVMKRNEKKAALQHSGSSKAVKAVETAQAGFSRKLMWLAKLLWGGAFLLACAALVCWGFSLLCVLLARVLCRVTQQLGASQVTRGGECRYTLRAFLPLPLPIAPLSLRVSLPSGRESEYLLPLRLLGAT